MYKDMSIRELSEVFVDNLLETNRSFKFYVNWENSLNYKEFENELKRMNSLLDCTDIHAEFIKLCKEKPTIVATFPLLFALSKNERKDVWEGKQNLQIVNEDFEKDFYSFSFDKEELENGISDDAIEIYYSFFDKMGLKNLFENILGESVIDYVIGVLVGLDSNGRKNRGGRAFEDACEPIISEVCNKYGITLISQKQFKVLKEYGINVSPDVANRKADFILLKGDKILNIEVDYFFRGGSKPEEIIDSYINRKNDLKKIGIGFILLTDGMCWDNKDKSQLQKGFRSLDYLMNYYLAKYGMLDEVIKEYFL